MAMMRRTGSTGLNEEEFLQHLYRGGELMAAGKVAEAKDALEKAFALKPKNEKAQNLLGLAHFKLGSYDRAAEIYEMLVRENPADHTLRVNLGLVFLKRNALDRAIKEFETSVDLAPDHKKAQNYLGLALAQAGQYARAREHFVLAGSELMVQKMDRAISGEVQPAMPASQLTPEVPGEAPREAPVDSTIEVQAEAPVETSVSEPGPVPEIAPLGPMEMPPANWGEQTVTEPPLPALPPQERPERTEVTKPSFRLDSRSPPAVQPPAAVLTPAEATGPAASPSIPLLPSLTSSASLLTHPPQTPFQVEWQTAYITVEKELLTRLSGLVASRGKLTFEPAKKRFRGRDTDQAFGEADLRINRAKGSGLLIIHSPKVSFFPILLTDESVYFKEDVVFAFEEAVIYENGRLPSDNSPDLHLVHLRGHGAVLLAATGIVRSVPVEVDKPVTLPLDRLIGWHGELTPRMVPLLSTPKITALSGGVELSGTGYVLCAVTTG